MNDTIATDLPASGPRRKFIRGNAALLGAVLVSDALAAGKACRPTVQDIIGPFYRFGAPFETRIAGADEAGERPSSPVRCSAPIAARRSRTP